MTDTFISKISESESIPQNPVDIKSGEKIGTSLHTPIESDPPLESWSEVKGMPYTAEYLGVNVWNEGAKHDVDAVEGYILNEIKQKGLEPTTDSYREIMSNIERFLQLSPNIASNVKYDKVLGYVKLFAKYKKKKEEMTKIIGQANELREVEYG